MSHLEHGDLLERAHLVLRDDGLFAVGPRAPRPWWAPLAHRHVLRQRARRDHHPAACTTCGARSPRSGSSGSGSDRTRGCRAPAPGSSSTFRPRVVDREGCRAGPDGRAGGSGRPRPAGSGAPGQRPSPCSRGAVMLRGTILARRSPANAGPRNRSPSGRRANRTSDVRTWTALGIPAGRGRPDHQAHPSGPAYSLTIDDARSKVDELRELVPRQPRVRSPAEPELPDRGDLAPHVGARAGW